jgi:hypothetical protein
LGNYRASQERILDFDIIRNLLCDHYCNDQKHHQLGFPDNPLYFYHYVRWSGKSLALKHWIEETIESLVSDNMVLITDFDPSNNLSILCFANS